MVYWIEIDDDDDDNNNNNLYSITQSRNNHNNKQANRGSSWTVVTLYIFSNPNFLPPELVIMKIPIHLYVLT